MKRFILLFLVSLFYSGFPINLLADDYTISSNSTSTNGGNTINGSDSLLLESGIGIAVSGNNKSGITKVLPNEPGKPTETHFVYPASLKNNARLVAFRNFLFSKVNEWKF